MRYPDGDQTIKRSAFDQSNNLYQYDCEFGVRTDMNAFGVIRMIGDCIEGSGAVCTSRALETNHFRIKAYDIYLPPEPWYCYYLDWQRDRYFEIRITYTPRQTGIDNNVQFVKQILECLWTNKVPAYVLSTHFDPEEGYESHLPMQGGNDLEQVFWREDHLAFRKKAGLESYLGPPIND
jgi:hypothetical protein